MRPVRSYFVLSKQWLHGLEQNHYLALSSSLHIQLPLRSRTESKQPCLSLLPLPIFPPSTLPRQFRRDPQKRAPYANTPDRLTTQNSTRAASDRQPRSCVTPQTNSIRPVRHRIWRTWPRSQILSHKTPACRYPADLADATSKAASQQSHRPHHPWRPSRSASAASVEGNQHTPPCTRTQDLQQIDRISTSASPLSSLFTPGHPRSLLSPTPLLPSGPRRK